MADLSEEIVSALRRPEHFSQSLTERLASCSEEISRILVGDVAPDERMNVSSSIALHIRFSESAVALSTAEREAATYDAQFLVSARADLFTIIVLQRAPATTAGPVRAWSLVPPAECERVWWPRLRGGSEVLEARGFKPLAGSVLQQSAPGHKTKLDDAPATVFEVLFAELIG